MKLSYFLIPVALILTLTSCQKKGATSGERVVNVTAFKVEPQTIPAIFTYVGAAVSSHPVEIRARVEGYITKIDYNEGSPVKAGQVLFELDPQDFEAAVNEAKSNVDQAEALYTNAVQNLERLRPLYEQNAVSKKDLDFGVSQELSTKASLSAARARLAAAELNLSYTKIRSPIDGLSSFALSRAGSLIIPSINGLLTTVSVIDPIWVTFSISENEILNQNKEVEEGRLCIPASNEYHVRLLLANNTYYPHEGKVDFSSPTLDPLTGTMMIRSSFPNPNGVLRPGQFVRAKLLGATRPNAVIVPQEAVLQGNTGMFVYVINAQNKVEARMVIEGEWYFNYWIINTGLNKGDLIVVEGTNKVQSGSKVHVTKTLEPKLP